MRLREFHVFAVAVVWAVIAGGWPHAQSSSAIPTPPSGSPAGPLAYSCGVPGTPPAAGRGLPQPTFPPGQDPVALPVVSHLGAPNDLPNPYQPGVDWGQLPPGRKWGSTASITTAPDGTIWVVDPYPYPAASSLAEGVTVDAEGNVYGADFLMDVRKFVKKPTH